MSLQIAALLFLLGCKFCDAQHQPIGELIKPIVDTSDKKSTNEQTILSRIENETKGCLTVNKTYFLQCERPEHNYIENGYPDYSMMLCMGCYDAALRICSFHNTDIQTFVKSLEDDKNNSDFCKKLNSVLSNSSVPNTSVLKTKWMSVLRAEFSQEENCKSYCVNRNTINPLCKFWANSLLYEFKSIPSTVTTGSTRAVHPKLGLRSNLTQEKKPDSVSLLNKNASSNPTHFQQKEQTSSTIATSAKEQDNNGAVDSNLKNKSLSAPESAKKEGDNDTSTSPHGINISNSTAQKQGQTSIDRTDLVVEEKTQFSQPGKMNNNESNPETPKKEPGKLPSISSSLQETTTNGRNQESRPQESNKVQSSTTGSDGKVEALKNDVIEKASISVPSSTITPTSEEAENQPLEIEPSGSQVDKPEGTEGEENQSDDPILDETMEGSNPDDSEKNVNIEDQMDVNDEDVTPERIVTLEKKVGKKSEDGGTTGYTDSSMMDDKFQNSEDSHFFAYFMTMVVLCIICYLVFHNKQKILALLLEGRVRRGTRRRPNTSGYRKLDSNLEEAVTSACSTSVTHVIY